MLSRGCQSDLRHKPPPSFVGRGRASGPLWAAGNCELVHPALSMHQGQGQWSSLFTLPRGGLSPQEPWLRYTDNTLKSVEHTMGRGIPSAFQRSKPGVKEALQAPIPFCGYNRAELRQAPWVPRPSSFRGQFQGLAGAVERSSGSVHTAHGA